MENLYDEIMVNKQSALGRLQTLLKVAFKIKQ